MIGYLENFDKFGGHNKVYGPQDVAPTILLNAGKGYPPLIIVTESDDDQGATI